MRAVVELDVAREPASTARVAVARLEEQLD
jgi:hypothetical protein